MDSHPARTECMRMNSCPAWAVAAKVLPKASTGRIAESPDVGELSASQVSAIGSEGSLLLSRESSISADLSDPSLFNSVPI